MNLSKLKPFKKTTLILLISLFGMLAAAALYTSFFIAVKNSTVKTALIQDEVSVLQTQEAESEKLKKNVANTTEQQKILASYFIDMNDPVSFFDTIEGYGTSVGVKTVFNNVEIKTGKPELDAVISVSGSFSGVYKFVSLLETAPYEFAITRVDLEASVPTGLEPVGKGPHTSGWEAKIYLAVKSIIGTK